MFARQIGFILVLPRFKRLLFIIFVNCFNLIEEKKDFFSGCVLCLSIRVVTNIFQLSLWLLLKQTNMLTFTHLCEARHGKKTERTDVKFNIKQTCMTESEIIRIYWTAFDTNDNLESAVTF